MQFPYSVVHFAQREAAMSGAKYFQQVGITFGDAKGDGGGNGNNVYGDGYGYDVGV